MKLLVDPEIFFYGRCGMVRYYSTLSKHLELKGIQIDLPLIVSGSDFIDGQYQSLYKINRHFLHGRSFHLFIRLLNKLSKRSYYKKLRKGDYDGIFITSPTFEDSFLTHIPDRKPVMMVVHDTMRCVLGPDGLYDPAGSNTDRLAYLINRVTTVFAISNQTKSDILHLVTANENRIKVVHTGNLLLADIEKTPSSTIPSRFLLFVGDRTGRKNFRFFIQSIAPLLMEQPDLNIVCTGETNVWEQDLLSELGVQARIHYISAPDEVLVYLYKNAVALVFPSLYEGFGLPVLEAMSFGCPVITTTCGALQEVGGEAVMYVDPRNASSIINGVRAIVDNAQKAQELKEKGLIQAQKFTLENMVNKFEEEIIKACINK